MFIPAPGGTRAVIVVDSKLGGSLPNSICQMASAHQPSTMHKLRVLLDKRYPGDPSQRLGVAVPASSEDVYKQLLVTAQRLQGSTVEILNDGESVAAAPSVGW